jgi:hypothetical protein
MCDAPGWRLSGPELASLRFAARRQLARWSNKHLLSPNQQAQRNALARAVRVLQEDALTEGCELRPSSDER